ncbi:phenylalanine--tRNA ligase subunit beta, partial [Candidatus Peregrinibacteria bacterium RIFOXYC2_FULL_41_22]
MRISLNWLRDYVKIDPEITPKHIGEMLTLHTAEVESVEDQGENFRNMVVGKIIEVLPHPNADKLKIVMVDVGETHPRKIVCGGVNVRAGLMVPVALIGAMVKWHGQGDLIKLEEAEIRGEKSYGMICAGEEIGLSPCPEGEITELKTKAKPGTPLAEALDLNDAIIEIDNKSLTHRPDLWGHYGIAREVAALTGKKLKKLTPKVEAIFAPQSDENLSIDIKNPELCPRYIGVKVSGIEVKESPKWLKKKLEAAGHATYNNIVDITNFISSELGQPMHAFDASLIKGGIVVRTATLGEKIKTLDGIDRELTDKNLLIADHEKPIAIAGVMGGEFSGINEQTNTIIFEAATFDAVSVRKTSTALGLRTEAVQRFEKSIDPNLAQIAMLRALEILKKICPTTKIEGQIIDIKNFNQTDTIIETSADRIASKIGAPLATKDIVKILKSLEFGVQKQGKKLLVQVPT